MKERRIHYPTATLDPAKVTGLILCGMGGPDGPDAVKPFLRNLFADPAILPVPSWISPFLGWVISNKREAEAKQRYLQMSPDGVTPQLPTTRAQSERICDLLTDKLGGKFVPNMAMRYWHPFPDQCVDELLAAGAEQFVIVPMYPQYSCATNGSTLLHVQDSLRQKAPGLATNFLPEWPDLPGMIEVIADGAVAGLRRFKSEDLAPAECAHVFVAHSLPQKMIDKGDPYQDQVLRTVHSVHRQVAAEMDPDWFTKAHGGREPMLAFQSRVGPIKWLGPDIVSAVAKLGARGVRCLHLTPISFTCEHIETVMELDVELKVDADMAGIERLSRGQALNMQERWLDSMAETIVQSAFGPVGSGT